MLYFGVKKGVINWHRDLNSMSSSTEKTNLLGPMTTRLHSPVPRVRKSPRAGVLSVVGNTFLNLKPVSRNSLELVIISTGGRDVSTSGVHSWNVSPDGSVYSDLHSVWPHGPLCWRDSIALFHLLSFKRSSSPKNLFRQKKFSQKKCEQTPGTH